MIFCPTSNAYNAIYCERCKLRVVIPTEIYTYEKLLQWCAQKIRDEKLWEKRLMILWGLVPMQTKQKIEADIETEERKTVAMVADAVREMAKDVKGLTPESAEIVRAADESAEN